MDERMIIAGPDTLIQLGLAAAIKNRGLVIVGRGCRLSVSKWRFHPVWFPGLDGVEARLVRFGTAHSHATSRRFPSLEACRIDCCGSWARQRVNCRIGPALKFHRVCFVDCPAVGPLNDRTGGSDPRVDAGNL